MAESAEDRIRDHCYKIHSLGVILASGRIEDLQKDKSLSDVVLNMGDLIKEQVCCIYDIVEGEL